MSAALFRSRMQRLAARISLKLCKKFGVQISYTSRGETDPVDVWCKPTGIEGARDESVVGTMVQQSQRSFVIPIQSGFPPTGGLMINDVIVDEKGDRYRLVSWTNQKGADDIEYEYQAIFERKQAKRSGQTGSE